MIDALDNHFHVGDFVIEVFLRDLDDYFDNQRLRDAADARISAKAREHPGRVMLLGHSMGSIVGSYIAAVLVAEVKAHAFDVVIADTAAAARRAGPGEPGPPLIRAGHEQRPVGRLVDLPNPHPLGKQISLELGGTFLGRLSALERASELLAELVSVRVLTTWINSIGGPL